MNAKQRLHLVTVTLIFTLIIGLFLPASQNYFVSAEENPVQAQDGTHDASLIDQAINLKNGDKVEGTFDKPGARWYTFTPTKAEIEKFSHVELEAKSDQVVVVSFYSSKENAQKEHTFEPYMANTDPSEPAKIDFPYAWEGPYYVKVEYFGESELDEPQSAVSSEVKPEHADYTIAVKGVNKPPSKDTGMGGMQCVVEESVKNKPDGENLLETLRFFRDGVLAKTEDGRKLSSLYYKSAPFLVIQAGVNKNTRDELYKNLKQLKPLVDDLNKNGASTAKVISKQDQAAILALSKQAENAVPDALKKEIQAVARKADLQNISGDSPVIVAKKIGVKLPARAATNGKMIVKLKPGKSLSNLKRSAKTKALAPVSTLSQKDAILDDLYVVDLNDQLASGLSETAKIKAVDTAVSQAENLPEVEFAEPVKRFKAIRSNDVQYSYQWSLENLGKDGKKGADIQNNKLQALVQQRNLKDTLIAVVDTGVDPDLADLKGVVNMSAGKNFVDETETAADDNGHGTHVAGIIAATANNGYSMQGINQHAKILPVKVIDAMGDGDTEQIAYGIKYAADQGADVINMSLGFEYSRTVEYVLKYAASKNVVLVAASGNNGGEQIDYPGSSKYTITVGSTNSLDLVSDFSSYGKGLDIVAPGSNIPSLVPSGSVTYMSGTSMATPHVAAIAGLLLSNNPNLKAADVRTALRETTVTNTFVQEDNFDQYTAEELKELKLPLGADLVSGFGRMDGSNVFRYVDLRVKINPIYDNRTKLTGTAVKGAKVEVRKGKQVLAKGTVNAKGAFALTIPVQKAAQPLLVTITDAKGKEQSNARIYVAKGKAPAQPKVKAISNRSTTATGTAPVDTKVVIRNAAKKIIAQGKVNSKGQFNIKLAKQKAGTTLYVTAVDLANRASKPVKVTVLDKIAPAAPKVNKVTTKSKTVNGKAEKGATVTLKSGKKVLGSAKVNSKGNYSIKIKQQKKGTVLYVSAKDKAGNVSKATKVVVQAK